MSKKTIKLELSQAEYEEYQRHARDASQSVPGLIKSLLKEETKPKPTPSKEEKKPFFDLQRDAITDLKEQEYLKRNKYWASKLKEQERKESSEKETDDARKKGPSPVNYARRGDRIYPLWKSKAQSRGDWIPSVGADDLFWYEEANLARSNYNDLTDKLSEFENAWLDAWINDFERMDELWWYRSGALKDAGIKFERRHAEELLECLAGNVTLEELAERDKYIVPKKTFMQRLAEYLEDKDEEKMAEVDEDKRREYMLKRYDEAKEQRAIASNQLKERVREEMRIKSYLKKMR